MDTKRFQRRKEDFACEHCGAMVKGNGFTDHCPKCLYSKHVDINPGDRACSCRGMMVPVAASYKDSSFTVAYVCEKCGARKTVKAAPEDDSELLFGLAGKRSG